MQMIKLISNIKSIDKQAYFLYDIKSIYCMFMLVFAVNNIVERWLSWSKAHDWKSCSAEMCSGVRIPVSPPKNLVA